MKKPHDRVEGAQDGGVSRRELLAAAIGSAGALHAGFSRAADAASPSALRYTPALKEPRPIPPGEQGLQTVVAQPFLQVSSRGLGLEAASFDRAGNFLFVDVLSGTIFRMTPDKQVRTVFAKEGCGSAGIAIHRDGRIFVAGLGNFKDTGSVFWIRPDGTGYTMVVPPSAGYLADDLVFDPHGGFYFTDFRGSTNDPAGGVYYVAPDMKTITPILQHMAIANGVCLSPDGKVLWATELSAGRLHRVEMTSPTTIGPWGTAVPYHFTGFGPDSMRSDRDGNVYVAMFSQGRVLVLNPAGIPIGQILLPRRETGHNLLCTSMGFYPGSDRLLILTNDAEGGEGAWIFEARGFAPGNTLYSHVS
jgi:lactonase